MHFFKTHKNNLYRTRKKGAALFVIVFFFLFSSSAVVFGSIDSIVRDFDSATALTDSKISYFLAEAGVEDVAYRIKNNLEVSDTEEISLNGATTTVTVTDSGTNEKNITSLSDVLDRIRTIRTSVTTGQGVSFSYGLQVGAGGVELREDTTIVGSVYSNGSITGVGSNIVITGDATAASLIEEDLVERSIVCNTDITVGEDQPREDYAQSFQVSTSTPLAQISLFLKKVGDPDGADIQLTEDDSGKPDDDEIGEVDLNKNLVTTTYGWVDIAFPDPAGLSLNIGETYWIVLDADEADDDNYWVWCGDSAMGYGNGEAMYSEDWNDDPWTDISEDLTFKVSYGLGNSFIQQLIVNGTARAGTILNSTIFGDAYYQDILLSTVGGTSNFPSTVPPPIVMPVSEGNINQWKANAAAGTVYNGDCGYGGSVPGCTSSGSFSLGPAQITGDLILREDRTLTVNGTLHVEGNFTIRDDTTVRCAASYGDKSCVIVVDGWIELKDDSVATGSGFSESYIMLLTTIAGCFGNNTSHCSTDDTGIEIDSDVDASGAILYSTDSSININDDVDLGVIVAYHLKIEDDVTITYEAGFASTDFSAGPTGGWNIQSWQESE